METCLHGLSLACRRCAQPVYWLIAAMCLCSTPLFAQESSNAWASDVRALITNQFKDGNGRVEIEVGQLDSRLKLKPCGAIKPFVPPGAKLWGRGHIGLRCEEPNGWTAYLPINVHWYAPVAVAARPLRRDDAISTNDVRWEEQDLTRLTGPAAINLTQIDRRVLNRHLAAGQPLTLSALKPVWAISSGEPVKVEVRGDHFTIATSGIALAQAEEGQLVKVKLDTGRTVQGLAKTGRIVELQ